MIKVSKGPKFLATADFQLCVAVALGLPWRLKTMLSVLHTACTDYSCLKQCFMIIIALQSISLTDVLRKDVLQEGFVDELGEDCLLLLVLQLPLPLVVQPVHVLVLKVAKNDSISGSSHFCRGGTSLGSGSKAQA